MSRTPKVDVGSLLKESEKLSKRLSFSYDNEDFKWNTRRKITELETVLHDFIKHLKRLK